MTTSTRKSISITNMTDFRSGMLEVPKDESSATATSRSTSSISASSSITDIDDSNTAQATTTNEPSIQYHPPLRPDAWSEVSATHFHVRGKTYTNDKIKQPSEESAFTLLAIDLVTAKTPMYSGLCAHPDERIQTALRQEQHGIFHTNDNYDDDAFMVPEFVFAVNLCIPMSDDGYCHAVFYFGADKQRMEEIKQGTTPFGRTMNRFIFGNDDTFRDRSLKLIPRVVEGNYIIKHAVGTTPAVLGKEMKQVYVKGERYMEVVVDISSNTVANGITKLCLGYINNLSIDLMFVIEGRDELTLPERILGGARISHLDFNTKDGKRTVRSY